LRSIRSGGSQAFYYQRTVNRLPTSWLLGALWFFCLGGFGVFYPYFSLYLHENAGLTTFQAGVVFAMLPLVGLVAQPLWGQLSDRTGLRSRLLALLAGGAALGYTALYFGQGFLALLFGTAALAFFMAPLIPSCVAVTLALTRDSSRHAFGVIRAFGTIGFLVLIVVFPPFLHRWQSSHGLTAVPGGASEPGLEIMFPVAAAVVAIGVIFALRLPRTAALTVRAPRGDWRRLIAHGPFVRLLAFALLANFVLQGPMVMFPIFVRAHGGSLDTVSQMWILMLLVEIPLFAVCGETLQRIGPRGLLAMGVIAGGIRWAVSGLCADLDWIFAVQLLHGVTVVGLMIGCPLYVEAVVPERLRSTGQGMLAMVGASLGGICSFLFTGWLMDYVGTDVPYIAAGTFALVLGCAIPLIIPPAVRADAGPADPIE
jgi:PPP family 3-phenylpropionic acid transporter